MEKTKNTTKTCGRIVGAPLSRNTRKTDTTVPSVKNAHAITLIALVITILFSYDEKLKCSSNKGFLLVTI